MRNEAVERGLPGEKPISTQAKAGDTKPPPLGAFVHIVMARGDDVWFYANLPEHVMRQFDTSGAAEIEIIPILEPRR